MKKGRHRRYVEARALKHTNDGLEDLFGENEQPCEECDALPGQDHKSWCLNSDRTGETTDEGTFPT